MSRKPTKQPKPYSGFDGGLADGRETLEIMPEALQRMAIRSVAVVVDGVTIRRFETMEDARDYVARFVSGRTSF